MSKDYVKIGGHSMKLDKRVLCIGSHADCPRGCPHLRPHLPRKARQSDWDGLLPCSEKQECGAVGTSRSGMQVQCVRIIVE
jgi:hypothetical protein